jgi:hypothetical protein
MKGGYALHHVLNAHYFITFLPRKAFLEGHQIPNKHCMLHEALGYIIINDHHNNIFITYNPF